MSRNTPNRRDFLKTTTGVIAAVSVPYVLTSQRSLAQEKNDRPNVGCIGLGGMGRGDGRSAARFADIVACCDVDSAQAGKFVEELGKMGKKAPEVYEDYHKILDRDDIEVVTIGTPDHWHSKIVIDALKAGKDVQCQKPLTLTIDEGKQICKVVKETGKILHIGTQQRSENRSMFLKAVALARSGRLGKKLTATCSIGGAPGSNPFPTSDPPANLNWDRWLGQAPVVPYCKERCHGSFRWWLEYSGGKMTDWGAHHIDIAQWALGYENSGPSFAEGTGTFTNHPAEFDPIAFLNGEQKIPNGFNTATKFSINLTYENGHEMIVQDGPDNGIWIEGELGRIFVNRGKLTGKPIEELTDSDKEWLDEEVVKLYNGQTPRGHMQHFFECLKERTFTISDPFTHHRSMTACHICNIALLLKRKIQWDPAKEDFVGDDQASALRSRKQREPYTIDA
jgi:myo-inositol 2-dehydrogenase/D-chiro-inositol 1-dehydrogenase